jgi:hypothetical protein
MKIIYSGALAPILALEENPTSRYYGWLFVRHSDGNWVTLADLKGLLLSAPGPEVVTEVTEAETRADLSCWFGLSRNSFAVLARVLMEAMPEEWQKRIAVLLNDYTDTWTEWPEGSGCRVQYEINGRIAKMPEWLRNYRHPDGAEIEALRAPPAPEEKIIGVWHRETCPVSQPGYVADVTPGRVSACTCDFAQRLKEALG